MLICWFCCIAYHAFCFFWRNLHNVIVNASIAAHCCNNLHGDGRRMSKVAPPTSVLLQLLLLYLTSGIALKHASMPKLAPSGTIIRPCPESKCGDLLLWPQSTPHNGSRRIIEAGFGPLWRRCGLHVTWRDTGHLFQNLFEGLTTSCPPCKVTNRVLASSATISRERPGAGLAREKQNGISPCSDHETSADISAGAETR